MSRVLLLLALSQFSCRIGGVDFCGRGIGCSDAFEMDVIGNGDMIALPLEGFQLFPPQSLSPFRCLTPFSLFLRPAFPILPLEQLPRDVQTAKHIRRHIADVWVCTPHMLAQHTVVILVHLKTGTDCGLAGRCRCLSTLILAASLISLLRSFGHRLSPSLRFLSVVVGWMRGWGSVLYEMLVIV